MRSTEPEESSRVLCSKNRHFRVSSPELGRTVYLSPTNVQIAVWLPFRGYWEEGMALPYDVLSDAPALLMQE